MPFEVKYASGQTATFENKPTDQDIDEVAQRFSATTQRDNTQTPSAKPKKRPGALKKLGGALIQSEKNFGESIAGAIIPHTKSSKALGKARTREEETKRELVQLIKEKRERGEDTTRLMKTLKGSMGETPSDFDINPSLNKTTKQILGEAAGVGIDILSAGAFGKLAKGAKPGRLLKGTAGRSPVLGGGTKTLKGSVAKGAGTGALIGVGSGGARAAQEGRSVAEGAIVGSVLGGGIGAGTGVLGNIIGKGINKFLNKAPQIPAGKPGRLGRPGIAAQDFAGGIQKGAKDEASEALEKNLQKKVMPALTANEQRLIKSQQRGVRGKVSKLLGGEADIIKPDAKTKRGISALKSRIKGVASMDDIQIAKAADDEIGSIAEKLSPEMKAVEMRLKTVTEARSKWNKLKAEQIAEPEFDGFAGSKKFQARFDTFMDQIIAGVKKDPKTGKVTKLNLDDVWQLAKDYDDIIVSRIKKANELSGENQQWQNEMWSKNRRILRDLLEDGKEGLGSEAKEAFRDMTGLYRIQSNINNRPDLVKEATTGLITPKTVAAGALGIAGTVGLPKLFRGNNSGSDTRDER